jgi:hypothetical protein
VAGAAKLAPGSLLTAADQERLYREQMGADAAERQVLAAKLERGQCVCTPAKVRKRWEGADRPSLRTVHATTCPRFRPWMAGS